MSEIKCPLKASATARLAVAGLSYDQFSMDESGRSMIATRMFSLRHSQEEKNDAQPLIEPMYGNAEIQPAKPLADRSGWFPVYGDFAPAEAPPESYVHAQLTNKMALACFRISQRIVTKHMIEKELATLCSNLNQNGETISASMRSRLREQAKSNLTFNTPDVHADVPVAFDLEASIIYIFSSNKKIIGLVEDALGFVLPGLHLTDPFPEKELSMVVSRWLSGDYLLTNAVKLNGTVTFVNAKIRSSQVIYKNQELDAMEEIHDHAVYDQVKSLSLRIWGRLSLTLSIIGGVRVTGLALSKPNTQDDAETPDKIDEHFGYEPSYFSIYLLRELMEAIHGDIQKVNDELNDELLATAGHAADRFFQGAPFGPTEARNGLSQPLNEW